MFLKVATVLVLLTILVQAKPVEKKEALHDPFDLVFKKSIEENDFKAFYDLTKQMQSILTETKKNIFALMVMKFTSERENNIKDM